MSLLRWAWQGDHYWPLWMASGVVLFTVRETVALVTGDTLSRWVRSVIHITANDSMASWPAGTYAIFVLWVLVITWLTWHLFFYTRMRPFLAVGLLRYGN